MPVYATVEADRFFDIPHLVELAVGPLELSALTGAVVHVQPDEVAKYEIPSEQAMALADEWTKTLERIAGELQKFAAALTALTQADVPAEQVPVRIAQLMQLLGIDLGSLHARPKETLKKIIERLRTLDDEQLRVLK